MASSLTLYLFQSQSGFSPLWHTVIISVIIIIISVIIIIIIIITYQILFVVTPAIMKG
jgi:hypothetical protein